jgi:hypothetical protein
MSTYSSDTFILANVVDAYLKAMDTWNKERTHTNYVAYKKAFNALEEMTKKILNR